MLNVIHCPCGNSFQWCDGIGGRTCSQCGTRIDVSAPAPAPAEPTLYVRPRFEPVEYARPEDVQRLSRIGRRLFLTAQRDRREGERSLRYELHRLELRERTNNEQMGDRFLFLQRRVQWLERVLLFAVLVLGACVLLALLTGCAGEPFEAAPGSSSSPSSGAPSLPSHPVAVGGELVDVAGAGGAAAGGDGAELGGAPPAPTTHACPRAGWVATAWAEWVDGYGGPAELALDGDERTRWTGGAEQTPGQWFAVAFGAELELERVLVRSVQFPSDAPRWLTLELDGRSVSARQSSPAPGVVVLELEQPTRAASLRVVVASSGVSWWSIDELSADCR